MKKRWMASILDTSRQPTVVLPFNRTARKFEKTDAKKKSA